MWCYDSLENVCEELLWLEPPQPFLSTDYPTMLHVLEKQFQPSVATCNLHASDSWVCSLYFIRSARRLDSMGRGIPFQLFEWSLPSGFQSSFYNEPANLHLFCTSFPSTCKLLLVTHSVELPKQRFFSLIEDHFQIIPPLCWNISESNGHPGMG